MDGPMNDSNIVDKTNNSHVEDYDDFVPDVSLLSRYMLRVSTLLLDGTNEEFTELFSRKEVEAKLQEFAKHVERTAVFVYRTAPDDNEEDDKSAQDTQERPSFALSLEVTFTTEKAHGLAFVKINPTKFSARYTKDDKQLASQLQVIELGEASPFDTLHSYVANALEPYFSSFAKSKYNYKEGETKDVKIGIPAVFHNLEELKLSLYQCQQNMAIPEINLSKHVHSEIKKLVAQGKPVDAMEALARDAEFLNDIQRGVREWVKDIRQITDLQHRSPTFQNALQEINFWAGLERALHNIELQLKSKEIETTLEVLLKARRFHVTTSLKTDSGLESAMTQVRHFNSLLKDLPIQDLLSAKDVERMTLAIIQIFAHLKKIKNFPYPVPRAVALVEAVSRDLNEQLNKVLGSKRLLYLGYDEFDKATNGCAELFTTWDQQLRQFDKFAHDLAKKRSESIPDKYHLEHEPLRRRVEDLRRFRRQHEELRLVIDRVLPSASLSVGALDHSINAIEEINSAYEDVRNIDNKLLDSSHEGQEVWEASMKTYNSRIDRVETHIIVILRDKLGAAQNASEMFRVFSKFNALFFRPRIRGAIQEYQARLIEKVKEDIRRLQDKFKIVYKHSETSHMSNLRDLPEVSGAIIWAKQIERQLGTYMRRVEDVFGKGWERLKLLRRPDKLWSLNESLSDFMGIPLPKLHNGILQNPRVAVLRNNQKPEILGTALSLAFLEVVFADYKSEWDLFADESKHALDKEEQKAGIQESTKDAAATLLKDLGVGSQHVEGKNLRSEGESFRKKLNENIDKLIVDWSRSIFTEIDRWSIFSVSKDGKVTVGGNIFDVRTGELGDDELELAVNFHPNIVTLIKEIRNLRWLNMLSRLDNRIGNTALAAIEIHPFAISLTESIKTFNQAAMRMQSTEGISPLLAAYVNEVHNQLAEGFKLTWGHQKLEKYSKELSDIVLSFQEKVNDLIAKNEQINITLDSLKTCPLKDECFQEILAKIQKLIDDLNLASYSNLGSWVSILDKRVETILTERLKDAIALWVNEFENLGKWEKEQAMADDRLTSDGSGALTKQGSQQMKELERQQHLALLKNLNLQPYTIYIKLNNRTMNIEPPVERARVYWLSRLHACISWICDLPRVQSSRFDTAFGSSQVQQQAPKSYNTLLRNLPEGMLKRAYDIIEAKIKDATIYIQTWLQYQALWDMDNEVIYSKLGDNLHLWQQLIYGIRKARSVIDASVTTKDFGAIIVDYKQVQTKVSLKYDDTSREVLFRFREKLNAAMHEFYTTIKNEREVLERANFELNMSDAVHFLTQLQVIKKKYPIWEKLVQMFFSGQKTLEGNKVKLPDDWIYVDNINGEWSAFNQVFQKRSEALEKIKEELVRRVLEDDKQLEARIKEYLNEWNQGKPSQGDIKPSQALNTISMFESKLTRINDEFARICQAKEALDLEIRDVEKLDPLKEELGNLKEVWSELKKIWDYISELREIPFNSVIPRKIRSRLDEIASNVKQLPSRMRSYNAVEYVANFIKSRIKANAIVTDLRSEAMKERHWKELAKRLNSHWVLSDLTLGHIWDIDILRHENIFKDVIRTAEGELALEDFLRQVREFWEQYQLDLANYQNKCRLIRGWDELFTKIQEHLTSLGSMKMSPFFKVFEEACTSWEDKLNRLRVLLDVWIDVQRRWVYLEGVFTGSADIKHQLPRETQKFQAIDSEFIALMRKVQQDPSILNVLAIPNILKSLEKLAELLAKIQKALGEYLERQRAAFPRFYFLGDEDLLEIIGQSKDPGHVLKHLKKMFAGIGSLVLDPETLVVSGMISKEGETVPFKTPISIKENPKINEWLSMVETEMRRTLAILLEDSVKRLDAMYRTTDLSSLKFKEVFSNWIKENPAQLVVLSSQVVWTQMVDRALTVAAANLALSAAANEVDTLAGALTKIENILNILADFVLADDQDPSDRKKFEHLITELVHQRDVVRKLIKDKVSSPQDFNWLYYMRFYWDATKDEVTHRLRIEIANATFLYGFEYLGVADKLVQTPLTDRCYLTLTQALNARLGGSPFGPAGTGKTETVKALGNQMGRFVLVFCCDENFDFKAMGRIFVGLCQCGAWGCFDEFNRLEERILSAVSQQIQTIQIALRDRIPEVELIGRQVKVSPDTGIFVTMNPGYAGRSNLPDNLKQLFRAIAMVKPDREMIAQVMLYSQGFRTAEKLASKIVPFFQLCNDQLSQQSHYDFGLRALKAVLVSAGSLKRKSAKAAEDNGESIEDLEKGLLIRSVSETMIPKLVADDIPLLRSLLLDVFPGSQIRPDALAELRKCIEVICKENAYTPKETWVEKIIQLYQIQALHHGLMLVGPSGCGKTSAWRVLLSAIERVEGVEACSYVIDPKALTKEELYGYLDATTREWTDGIFTHTLRKIVDNVRGGEDLKRHWIVFDGDVDPEWVENLNSVLDDNKLLTLPNGERLALPANVRIVFEVQDLKYATLATVSRCGMVWFSEDVVTLDMILSNYLLSLRDVPLDVEPANKGALRTPVAEESKRAPSSALLIQRQCSDLLSTYFEPDGLVSRCLQFASEQTHIMDFTRLRVLTSVFSLLNKGIMSIIDYNVAHPDFPLSIDVTEKYITRRLIFALLWGCGGSMNLQARVALGQYIASISTIPLPSGDAPLIDYEPRLSDGEWIPWKLKVPTVEVEANKAAASDVVIPTLDTVRHEEVLLSWISAHQPLLLCGPPGSGKTMTLTSVLRFLPDYDVVFLNFSSATQPEMILKTFEQYCEFKRTADGTILHPIQPGKWLVVFCDEINLPAADKYGTQRVITFMRQLTEQGGYWRASDLTWIKLERIQFVGACNPPTDPGRVPLTHRFLRHAPLLLVDFPAKDSLIQIYGTFIRALLKMHPNLRGYADPLTHAMVEFYTASQQRFTPDIQAHYIYSPRELSRWTRAISEAIKPIETLSVEELVRLYVHEGLRLFQDRLVLEDEKKWTDDTIDAITYKFFPSIGDSALRRPILFSNWLTKDYVSVDREELRAYVQARLKSFAEEELEVQLVVFDSVLDHVLRIDRVLRQPLGHLLLVGVSGGGKTVLSRFVAWMNGLSVFQIKAHRKYSLADFEDDLRTVMKRAGCQGEKICFIFDESNVLDASFLEYMNALLASGEVPGLFEGDEFTSLIHQCKEASQAQGQMLDTEEEMYRWFISQVQRNLHVVFTMNPANPDFQNRAATSPALYNRCVIDWFGEWSQEALRQVADEFTRHMDLSVASSPTLQSENEVHQALVGSIIAFHNTVVDANARLAKKQGRSNFITPRQYLDFIHQFRRLYSEKREMLQEQQLHLNVGLQKLYETEAQVSEMKKSLALREEELKLKNQQANEKLQQMVKDQQEAEVKKQESIELSKKLDIQSADIQSRKLIAQQELSEAEPALEDAKNSVKTIRKQHLDELRNLANPPEPIKKTLEAVCFMLTGEAVTSWDAIRKEMRKDTFIPSIVNYDTEKLDSRLRRKLDKQYLQDPVFNYETVNRASKACGPMVKWVSSQIKYADIVDKVAPLRAEVERLEEAFGTLQQQTEELNRTIDALERSIATYKEEYANLISETQAIKSEMQKVQFKVERSTKLLAGLSGERRRWEYESQNFKTQMSTVVGDVLLSAAFLAYIGYYDEYYRHSVLLPKWSDHLEACGIAYKKDLSLVEYLSKPDDRLVWHSNSLPADDLCVENAIMLHRFNRYPLIIDPTGQATEFVMNQFKGKNISKTSFLDDNFMKNLESALRFGYPLLVQDVENIDPILNPILNKEVRKTGGRNLIRVGEQDIDFSPSFFLIMSTRDNTFQFTPDLCSRVTFVNFTVTPSSLQSQFLNQVLKAERPDVNEKRADILKLQGEYKVRLKSLEKSLLEALSSASNILEDEKVISTLETLKQEAEEIATKVAQTDAVMEELSRVSALYNPFASACSRVYFTLLALSELHFLYHFSLRFFRDIVTDVLHNNPNLTAVKDPMQRLEILMRDLFTSSFRRVSRSLLHEDQLAFALRLAQIKLKESGFDLDEIEIDFLIKSAIISSKTDASDADSVIQHLPGTAAAALTTLQKQMFIELSKLAAFRPTMVNHMKENAQEWAIFLNAPDADAAVPVCWSETSSSPIMSQFRKLLLLKVLRPDCLTAGATTFVKLVLGEDFFNLPELDLKHVVETETDCYMPLVLCSMPGFDASSRIDDLAHQMKRTYTPVAMGSPEGYELADKAINAAVKSGSWVVLKNVHLAPRWLSQLEKRLHGFQLEKKTNPSFRLFMTSEVHPAIPANLLRQSQKFVFEPPPGIRANLAHTFSGQLPSERVDSAPRERSRLHLMMAWFHAVVQERLRYAPLGWSKVYEFNESDLKFALDTIDRWVDIAAKGRSNVDPAQLPWAAMHVLLGQCIYGGRIDNEFDNYLLRSFLEQFFTPQSYDDSKFKFFHSTSTESGDDSSHTAALAPPEDNTHKGFMRWIESLPDTTTPEWAGLPNNVMVMIMSKEGTATLNKLLRIQSMYEDEAAFEEEPAAAATATPGGAVATGPVWAKSLMPSITQWQQLLQDLSFTFDVSAKELQNPLARCFNREIKRGLALLRTIQNDIAELGQLSAGAIKSTNHHRALISALSKDTVPQTWKRFTFLESTSVNEWIVDFANRVRQLKAVAESVRTSDHLLNNLWLGGLLFPEAFITATRQSVAQKHNWSLEALELTVIVGETEAKDDQSFIVEGLSLECAKWEDGALRLSPHDQLVTQLPPTCFRWVKKAEAPAEADNKNGSTKLLLPLYLNASRQNILCTVELSVDANIPPHVWYQRGTAILAWTQR